MSRRGKTKKLTRSIERKIVPVNSTDASWTKHRYILWFGAYGSTYLMVWANSLDDALDEAIDWIAEHAPGLLADDAVNDEYKRLVAEGKEPEEAQTEAEVDTTQGGNHGNYINSWEWGIVKEDPSRADILDLQGRAVEHRARGVDVLAKKARAHARRYR